MARLSISRGTVLAVLFWAAIPASATNIVLNGDFETGDFTSWTTTNEWFIDSVNHTAAGTSSASTGCVDITCITTPTAFLFQDLPTVNGQAYTFTFWYQNNTSDEGDDNELQVLWGGTLVSDLVNQPSDNTWRQVTLMETATSGTTRIQFDGRNGPAFVFVDDVSVSANAPSGVPEPSTLALTGVGALVAALYRKRRSIRF